MDNIKILQIGVGSMGKRRIRCAQYLGYNNITCYDIRSDRRQDAVSIYGVSELTEISESLFNDYSHIIISTPPDAHVEYALWGVSKDKHVFIEASVVDDGYEELIKANSIHPNIVLAPSCTMRFDPIIIKVKELLDSKVLGNVLYVNHYFGQYLKYWHPYEDIKEFYVSKKETGAAREILPFDLVYLCWLFGDIKEIVALKKNSNTLGVSIDDIYSVIATTHSNVVMSIAIEVISKLPCRDTRVILEKGNIEINNVSGQLKVYYQENNSYEMFSRSKLSKTTSTEEMYINELSRFFEATIDGTVFPFSIEEDHKILKYLLEAENRGMKLFPTL